MGFPFVYCEYVLLPLVNKEDAFSQWIKKVNPGRKSEQRFWEKERVGGVEEMPYIAGEGDRYSEPYPVKYKLIGVS